MKEKKEFKKTEFFFMPIIFILMIIIIFFFIKFISKNIIVLSIIIIMGGIACLFLCLKLVKFMKLKPINLREYKKLLKEKKRYKEKTNKKENRIPLTSTKKLNDLIEEGNKLNKILYKGAIFFNNYFSFVFFSLYFGGVCIGRPFWVIKNIGMITQSKMVNL